jgi:hypothetical protein
MTKLFDTIDNFFNEIESFIVAKPKNNSSQPNKATQEKGLGDSIYSLFVSKDYDKGLDGVDGWRDDKEKFKIELLNDIKTFLFTKWKKSWRPSLVFDDNGTIISGFKNMSGRIYKKLSNVMSLKQNAGKSPFFATISSINKDKKAEILNKDKTTSIISFIPIYKDKVKTGKPDYFLPKFHSVINVDFVKGIKKPDFKEIKFEKLELNEYVENFINKLRLLKRLPQVIYDQSDACYYLKERSLFSMDIESESIHMVEIDSFENINEYYSTLFHEITHSTNNPARLGRGKDKTELDRGTEELVAEMGAMILCAELGLEYNRQNSLSYLTGWLTQAKKGGVSIDDVLLAAYSYACDSCEYLLKDIDLSKLVPKTMSKRASIINKEQTKKDQEKKPTKKTASKKETIKKDKHLLPRKAENKEAESLFKSNDLEVINHFKDERVRILFNEKPSNEVRTELKKKYSFIWSGKNKAWQRKNTRNGIDAATKFVQNYFDKKPTLTETSIEEKKKAPKKEAKDPQIVQGSLFGTKQVRKTANKPISNNFGLKGIDTMEEVETLKLTGAIGEFLGGYERNNYSIVLRGDKGAGKSRFLFQIINSFAEQNYKVAFLSLEMAANSSICLNYRNQYINTENSKRIGITDKSMNYEQLKKICKSYDVVAIDSWTKLKGMEQTDFDRLQKENPTTMFIVIFQSTTGKVTRGGNMPEYDASVVIHVHKGGLAECEKNRYAAGDIIYNVFNQQIEVQEQK